MECGANLKKRGLQTNISLGPKMKELANSTRSTSSVVDFFVVIIEMLFEFVSFKSFNM